MGTFLRHSVNISSNATHGCRSEVVLLHFCIHAVKIKSVTTTLQEINTKSAVIPVFYAANNTG